jgi:hypothetical protein
MAVLPAVGELAPAPAPRWPLTRTRPAALRPQEAQAHFERDSLNSPVVSIGHRIDWTLCGGVSIGHRIDWTLCGGVSIGHRVDQSVSLLDIVMS